MEEKKLTDEEIVKDVISHKNAAETYGFVQITGKQMRIWLDLIHRLQAENERLTEWKDKLQDTKDELEQQLIDTGFKEYCEENKRLTDENTELQKQVDESTRKAAFYYKKCKSYGIECLCDEELDGVEVE